MANDLAGDVTVEYFTEGITVDNAEDFVRGADLVFDQMDFYLIKERYALHRAFRSVSNSPSILSAWCVGWGTSVYKYDRDGQTIEDFYGLPEDAEMTPYVIRELLLKFVPQQWHYPDVEVILNWLINKKKVPLFAGTPPLAEALATQRHLRRYTHGPGQGCTPTLHYLTVAFMLVRLIGMHRPAGHARDHTLIEGAYEYGV